MFKFNNNHVDEATNGLIETEDFLAGFGEPLEEFAAPAPSAVPEPEPEPTASEAEYFEPVSDAFLELNQDTSGFLVETFDGLAAWLIAYFVAKNQESENYRLPHREIEKIKLLVGKMVPSHKPIMPNWMALLITIGGAYTPIVAGAMNDRKIQEQQAEIERLKAELQKQKNNLKPETEE